MDETNYINQMNQTDHTRCVVGLRCVDRSGNLHPRAKKIMTALIRLPAALAVPFQVNWVHGYDGVTETFIIVQSDIFIRFNLRRQA